MRASLQTAAVCLGSSLIGVDVEEDRVDSAFVRRALYASDPDAKNPASVEIFQKPVRRRRSDESPAPTSVFGDEREKGGTAPASPDIAMEACWL